MRRKSGDVLGALVLRRFLRPRREGIAGRERLPDLALAGHLLAPGLALAHDDKITARRAVSVAGCLGGGEAKLVWPVGFDRWRDAALRTATLRDVTRPTR